MNRIQALFQTKKEKILSIYCTAGFPKLGSTLEVMEALQTNGADIIELGIPYSDPLADGPIIQKSNQTALNNGMSIPILLKQLKNFREKIKIPVLLMGYINPVLQYGLERFCKEIKILGIDGLILPDLPTYEFETEYKTVIKKHDLSFIFLITPETSEERIRKIDALSSGFIYAVSASSTTGQQGNMEAQSTYFLRLQKMQFKNPVLVGFGIKDYKTFSIACQYTAGAIIGSAYIENLTTNTDIQAVTKKFLSEIKKTKKI